MAAPARTGSAVILRSGALNIETRAPTTRGHQKDTSRDYSDGYHCSIDLVLSSIDEPREFITVSSVHDSSLVDSVASSAFFEFPTIFILAYGWSPYVSSTLCWQF